MPSYEDCVSIRVLDHGFLQTPRQVLLVRRILDDRDSKRIVETQHALSLAPWNSLDLLDVADVKTSVLSVRFLHQQRDKHRPLRMGVNTASGALVEGCEKQRRAS